jgi:hypothetical protein
MATTVDIPARFWARVTKDPDPGCWHWTGAKASGYGRVYWFGKARPAHQITYEAYVGPIPEGMDLDHLCRVRECVNPAHLEAVTRRINLLRGRTIPAAHAERTHCPNGHEFTPENIYTWRNARWCRTCRAGVSRARDRSKYRIGLVQAACVMCGSAFEYERKSGGRPPNTCSEPCLADRKRKAARESLRRKRAASRSR